LQVNYEAELRVTYYLIRGIQNLLRYKPWEGAKMAFREKFGQETIAGTQEAKMGSILWYAQDTRALLRLAQACSGSLRLGSGIPTLSSG